MKYDDADAMILLIEFIDYLGGWNLRKHSTKKQSRLLRVFIYACQKKGVTDASIARALNKQPYVIRYHAKLTSEYEKQQALDFLKLSTGLIFEAWSVQDVIL